jgi:hypothetical protein
MPTVGRQAAQAKYNSKPEQVKRRMARNRARAAMIREGKARKGDGKDVGHADGNPMNTPKKGTKNLRMESKRANRSYRRTASGAKRNPRD